MRKLLFLLLLFVLGLKKTSYKKNKNTLIILIDGLSHSSLQYGMSHKSCPTISKLLKNDYVLNQYFCGLPAATTATEALLFYGTNHNIPGFTWYDRSLHSFIRGNRSKELSTFEDNYQKKRGLFKDGSVIMSVYSGGATQLVMSGRNLRFPKTSIVFKLMQYIALGILYPVQFLRTITLTLKTIILYRTNNQEESRKILETIFLGQFSCFLTEVEIYRGTSRIFVDFLLYDEYAHKYGPTHPSAINSLKLIDRYVQRILKSIKTSEFSYEVIILSDHGQSKSIPYDGIDDKSSRDIAISFQLDHSKVIKTYGTTISTDSCEYIYSVPGGSTLQLYFSHSLTKAYLEDELEKKYPRCIQNLLEKPAFGWILIRNSNQSTRLYNKKGFITFTLNQSPTISGSPFEGIAPHTSQQLIKSFKTYAHFPNNGDIVIFGNTTPTNEVYSFEKHRGTHGGFFGNMCYPFCITNNNIIKAELNNPSMTMESLFNKIEYNMK